MRENQSFSSEDLVILLKTSPKVPINKDQKVAVIGVVRPFVTTQVEKDYKVSWNVQPKKQLEAKYKNRPVLIAQAM